MSIRRAESIFEKIKLTGKWWILGTRKRKLYGELSGSMAEGFSLELEGALEDILISPTNSTIQGKTRDGGYVTLYECRLNSSRGGLPFGGRTHFTSYDVRKVLIGELQGESCEIQFDRLKFGLHLLENWHCENAFDLSALFTSIHSGRPMENALYRKPESVVLAETEHYRIEIEYEVSYPGASVAQTSLSFEHGARIVVSSIEDSLPLFRTIGSDASVSLFQLLDEITRFFSFAMSATTFAYDVSGLPAATNRKGAKKRKPKWVRILLATRAPEVLPKKSIRDMDLKPIHISRAPKLFVGKWLNNAKSLSTPITHYLDVVCGNTMYLETQAVNLVIAIEGYHRLVNPPSGEPNKQHKEAIKEILSSVPAEHKKWLKERLTYSNGLSLRKRFKELLGRYPETIEWLIGSKKDRDSFVKWALERRNTYSHGATTAVNFDKSDQVALEYYRVQYLRAILFMCFLSELGFTETEIDAILRDNQRLARVAGYHRQPPNPKMLRVRGKRGKWNVTGESLLINYAFFNKKAAVEKGHEIARRHGLTFCIHRIDGSVEKTHRYDKAT